MTDPVEVTHSFISAKGDGVDTTVVKPSDWNDGHVINLPAGTMIGRNKADGDGVAQVLSLGKFVVAGTVVPYAGSTVPAIYALCYGQLLSRTAQPDLFAAIGTTYGVGDGATTFGAPDLRGVAVFGLDNMGGTNKGNLSAVMASTTMGATGGVATESASVSGSANVSVGVSGSLTGSNVNNLQNTSWQDGPGAFHTACDQLFAGQIQVTVSGSMSGSGSGSISGSTSVVSNVPPAMVMNYCIVL